MKCNKRELSDVLGVSQETITAWVKAGCPIEHRGRGIKGSVYDSGAVHGWRVAQAESGSVSSAQERLTLAKAQHAELRLAELRGELARFDDVTDCWTAILMNARAKLLVLPTKLAAVVAAPGKLAAAESAARDIIYEALNELAADGIPEKTRKARERAAGGPNRTPQRKNGSRRAARNA